MKQTGGFVFLTAAEMREIDEEAISVFGLDVLSLMENAGARTAELARRILGGRVAEERVACLVGKGNNGGDGLVAARHLHNWGVEVRVALSGARGDFRDVPAKQLATVEKMGIRVSEGAESLEDEDLIIDALLGYSSRGDPRGQVGDLVRLANSSGTPIVALDIPSGLDPTTGKPNQPCIVAKFTLTLGFPKTGFLNPDSRHHVGELYVADIGMPKEIYAKYPQMQEVFEKEAIVRVPMTE